jgi:hypothetical protein
MFKTLAFICLAIWFPLTVHTAEKTNDEHFDFSIATYAKPAIATTFHKAFERKPSQTAIELSDGSIWVVCNRESAEVLKEINQRWRSGDEIRIHYREPKRYAGHYILKNARNDTVYLVDVTQDCSSTSNAYYIEHIDSNGYAILTKNGLQWSIGWQGSFTTIKWRKGDRILINKSYYHSTEDYLIINADNRSNVWASLIQWK